MSAETSELSRNAMISIVKRFPDGCTAHMVRVAMGGCGFGMSLDDCLGDLRALKTLGFVETTESPVASAVLKWRLTADGLRHAEREGL